MSPGQGFPFSNCKAVTQGGGSSDPWLGLGDLSGCKRCHNEGAGLSQPGGGSVSCEKSQWPAQNRLVLGSSCCSQVRAAGGVCQAMGLCLQHLPCSDILLLVYQKHTAAMDSATWDSSSRTPLVRMQLWCPPPNPHALFSGARTQPRPELHLLPSHPKRKTVQKVLWRPFALLSRGQLPAVPGVLSLLCVQEPCARNCY